MIIKLLGAGLIIIGCGSVGFYLCICHKREEEALRQLIGALDFMGCELQYRMTPLPALCKKAAAECTGVISELMCRLAQELESQISPNASVCMTAAMANTHKLPERTQKILLRMSGSLGRFDITGQLKGLEQARIMCRKELDELSSDRSARLRNYQTLALCVGAALAILFI